MELTPALPEHQPPAPASLLRLAILAACVGFLSWGAVAVTQQTALIAAIWPANGVVLAFVLCAAPRAWPAYLAAGFIANAVGFAVAGDSLLSSFGLSLINGIEILAAALAVGWKNGDPSDFSQPRILVRFMAGAVVVAPLIATILSAGAFLIMGEDATLSALIHLFMADALGIAVVTPFFIACLRGDVTRALGRDKIIPTLSWLVVVAGTCGAVFYQTTYPFLFFIPPALLAATVAEGFASVALYIPVLAFTALCGTLMEHGPFALAVTASLSHKMILAQLFILSNFLMAAYVAHTSDERRRFRASLEQEHWRLVRSEQILAESEARFRLLSENSADIVFQVGEDGLIQYASPSVEEVLGWKPEEMVGRMANTFSHPDDIHLRERMVEDLKRDTPLVTGRVRGLHKDGSYVWLERRARRVLVDGKMSFVSNVRDISAGKKAEELLEAANAKLSQMAMMDSLTGIANRRRLDEALAIEWRRAARGNTALSFLLLDVDRFKDYNDFYGHQGGDDCLHKIAQCVARYLNRPADLVARYGGEEIAFLLPNTDEAGAVALAEQVRLAIETMRIPHARNTGCGGIVTASIGAATYRPEIAEATQDGAMLIKMADAMLYEAKRTGRNRVMSLDSLPVAPPTIAPEKEAKRLAAVSDYTEKGWKHSDDLDRIARLAANLLRAPIGLISIVGKDKQVFVGRYGLETAETSRDVSFCAHTLYDDGALIVGDATLDPRFKNNNLVTGDMGVRFYAGSPLVCSEEGHHLGALCVLDTHARVGAEADQRKILADLASLAVKCMEEQPVGEKARPQAGQKI